MNVQKTEASLAKYHMLHVSVGFVFALILLLLPKLADVAICTILLALSLPPAILPEFAAKWLGGVAILFGGVLGALSAWGITILIQRL